MFTENCSKRTFYATAILLPLKVSERFSVYKKVKLLKFEGDWGEL